MLTKYTDEFISVGQFQTGILNRVGSYKNVLFQIWIYPSISEN